MGGKFRKGLGRERKYYNALAFVVKTILGQGMQRGPVKRLDRHHFALYVLAYVKTGVNNNVKRDVK